MRLAVENVCYHITSRGIRKDKIFQSDKDKSKFIEILRFHRAVEGLRENCPGIETKINVK